MIFLRMSDLQSKDIISVKDGKRIGRISDLIVNENGQILNIVVEPTKLLKKYSFTSEQLITFNQIVRFGSDVILVDLLNK